MHVHMWLGLVGVFESSSSTSPFDLPGLAGRRFYARSFRFRDGHLGVTLALRTLHANELAARLRATGAEQTEGHSLCYLRAEAGLLKWSEKEKDEINRTAD